MRLLIIEDEALIAEMIEETLLAAGHRVVGVCGSLAKGAELVATLEFDAVILDANLRGASTAPIAAELRARNAPFIVTSGYDSGQRNEALREAPFLRKPFKRSDLLDLVE